MIKLLLSLILILFTNTCFGTSFHIDENRLKINVGIIEGPNSKNFRFQKTGGFPFAQYAHITGDVNSLIIILHRYQDHQWSGWRTSKNAQTNMRWQENQIRKTGKLVLCINNPDQIKAFEYAISNDYVPLNLPNSEL
jgi:hypothetical protein